MTPKQRRTYGSGSVYKRKSDGRYCATIEAGYTKTGGRRRITVTGKTEAEAKTKRKLKLRELDRDQAHTSERTTVKAWSDTWLAMTEKTSRPKTHTKDRAAVRQWIVPTIGARRLDQLTPADRRAVTKAITDAGRTTTSAHAYQGTLTRLLKAAAQEGHRVPANALAFTPPSVAVNDRQAIPIRDVLSMLEVASWLPHGSRWVAAFLEGLRQGECLGLTWDEVDDETLTICWQLQPLPYLDKHDRSKGFRVPDGYEARQLDRRMHLVRPKSKAGWRVIPLIPEVAAALNVWRTQAPTHNPHGLVWPAANGAPANAWQDSEEWKALQDTAGVRHPNGRHYHLHEARHTTATILMEMGVPESVRIAIMGHSSIAVTRGYEHVDLTQAREALRGAAGRLGITAKT